MKQVGLLSAGCQPWNSDVVATSGDRFAYCATLAIYVYQVGSHSWIRNNLPRAVRVTLYLSTYAIPFY